MSAARQGLLRRAPARLPPAGAEAKRARATQKKTAFPGGEAPKAMPAPPPRLSPPRSAPARGRGAAPGTRRSGARGVAPAHPYLGREPLELGDAVLGLGVRREQVVHALAAQRVDDEEVGGGRRGFG